MTRLEIEITDQTKMINSEALKNASRPENQYDPPSGEEILKTWEPENFPLPFKDEDSLPYMTFSKDQMHAVLHRPLDGIEYHACFIYHETKGCIYICDCYNADANRIYIICGLSAFAPFLLSEEGNS